MVSLSGSARVNPRLTRTRLALLTGASLMAPAMLVMQSIRNQPIDVGVIAGGSVLRFLLPGPDGRADRAQAGHADGAAGDRAGTDPAGRRPPRRARAGADGAALRADQGPPPRPGGAGGG